MSPPAADTVLTLMFRCELCGRVVEPHTPAARIVTNTRTKLYPARDKAHTFVLLPSKRKSNGKTKVKDDPGGTGEEIARECNACPDCADRATH